MAKTNFSETLVAGEVASSVEVTTLLTEVALAADNVINEQVPGNAAFDPEKLDDQSATDAESRGTTTAGTSASPTKATTLVGELQQLRHMLRRVQVGDRTYCMDASDTEITAGWQELTPIGPNLLKNSSFEKYTQGANTAPDDWNLDDPGVGIVISSETTGVTGGTGKAVSITADAADQGINQVVTGLKSATRYLIGVQHIVGVGDFDIETSGALPASTDYQDITHTVSGVHAVYKEDAVIVGTTAVPGDITVYFHSLANLDAFILDHAYMYELSDGHATPGTKYGIRAETTAAQAIPGDATPAWVDATDFTVTLTYPSRGQHVLIVAAVHASVNNIATSDGIIMQMLEGANVIDGPRGSNADLLNLAVSDVLYFRYNHRDGTPGTSYTYKIQVREPSAGATLALRDNCAVEGEIGVASMSFIEAEVV